jgi:hypothetical protein
VLTVVLVPPTHCTAQGKCHIYIGDQRKGEERRGEERRGEEITQGACLTFVA